LTDKEEIVSTPSQHDPPPDRAAAAPVPVPKRYRTGTHRTVDPEETVARARRLFPIFGITRVANTTGLDIIGVPVVAVTRPNARSLSVSQGKGLTLAAARASGVMEAVEAYHAEHIRKPLVLASLAELRHDRPLLDVGGLPRLSISAFHDHLQLLWVEGVDLFGGRPAWVPLEAVHLNFTRPPPPGAGSFFPSSNGLSSGNHPLEAVSHGICELVEHDAATLWYLGSEEDRRRRRVDLETIDDPACREVLEKFERADIDALVWEITSDIGIPAFMGVIADRAPSPARPLFPMRGMGCHPSRGIALLRALTEAAQSRITSISGARDDVRRPSYQGAEIERATRVFQASRSASIATRGFREAPSFEGDTLNEDVAWELGRLRAAGLRQAVIVDLTRPELGIPVVRVVIPGLEGSYGCPGYVQGARARRLMQEKERPS
jgi:ribosomal protein S12 methylthiotransferase accessory factor